ncbi:MAG: helix-turn-helix domain-containing protein, partial [Pirellulales bacterium]|nr:helix-turn-helix domain-containing protein [Pirellulales bacterium]
MNLAEWLKNSKISARQLATDVETTEATISRLKHGRARPSLELAGRIARATGGAVTANDFASGSSVQVDREAPLDGANVLLVIGGG